MVHVLEYWLLDVILQKNEFQLLPWKGKRMCLWSIRLRRTASAGQIRRRVDLYRIYFCLCSRTLLPVHREKYLYTTSKATRFNLR